MSQRAPWILIALSLAACGPAVRGTTAATTDRPAPDFTAKRLDGGTFQLSTLRGRVVVLDIWADWCEGCEKELPVLDDLAARLTPLDATVVSVSIDENPNDALRFLRARAWKMTAVYDPSGRTGDSDSPPKMPAVGMDDEPDLPSDYVGQLAWPFTRRRATARS